MLKRHIYELKLADYTPHSLTPPEELMIRTPDANDRQTLAELMLAAYSGTIDDDGGIMEDAVVEVDNYLRGEYGVPLPDSSRFALDADQRGVCAVLLTRWGRAALPLVTFVMTDPSQQGKGLAALLLHQSLARLKEEGETAVRAVITDGNVPSQRLFAAAGFQNIETI